MIKWGLRQCFILNAIIREMLLLLGVYLLVYLASYLSITLSIYLYIFSWAGDDYGPSVRRCLLRWDRHRPRTQISKGNTVNTNQMYKQNILTKYSVKYLNKILRKVSKQYIQKSTQTKYSDKYPNKIFRKIFKSKT